MTQTCIPQNRNGIHLTPIGRSRGRTTAVLLALMLGLTPAAKAERTKLKPGVNMFSPEQDVEVGRQVAQDAERQLPILNDRRVDNYLNDLGRRLAAKAPGERYPYQFKAVNDSSINAFALPGGFLYVNRGVIEAADHEAQLAGVMGHEIGHVAMRHGTNQATKAYYSQIPLAILGGVLGSNSIGAVLTQVGAGFAVNSVLLKYSRDAERQADIIGTQILHDNDHNPRAMAQFFEKLEGGGRGPDWLSSHPNPGNRVENINKEISNLGGTRSSYRNDSNDFREIQRYVQSLPSAPRTGNQARRTSERRDVPSGRPGRPSSRYQMYETSFLRVQYPDNWRAYGQGSSFTLAPEGGIVDTGGGNGALAYGVIGSVFEPRADRRGRLNLEQATDQLVDHLMQANPQMRVAKEGRRTRIGGQPALATELTNNSPVEGREINWLVTVLQSEGLVYVVFVAPEREFKEYDRTFQEMLNSVRLTGR